MTIKNYSHTRLVLSQPVMSAAPALLLFEHHCRWAGVLWCCGGPAPVPVSRNPMLTARNAKKEKQNSKVPTRFQTDPSTPDGQAARVLADGQQAVDPECHQLMFEWSMAKHVRRGLGFCIACS
ncbi:TPA: hypothetical protein ACH3X3_009245 [Trebouxia sp. C0006]